MVWFENFEQKLSEGRDTNCSEEKASAGEIRPPLPQSEKIPQSVRLLIAEDNPVNQKLIKAMLTDAGYQVELVNNGKEAVECFCAFSEHFDMIIMDVQMPEMDGLAATKRIRAEGFDQIPIIALTAHAMEGDRENCLAAGMNDYLTKPIRKQIVIELIHHWVLKRNGS